MTEFYSYENFPRDLVNALKCLDHEVLTSYEAGQANQGISDEDVLKFAHARRKVIITLNREDFINLHRKDREHSGIMICKEDRDYQGQALKIHEFILTDNQSLKGRLIRIKKQNQPGQAFQQFVIQEY
jgi:hypothetical protein